MKRKSKLKALIISSMVAVSAMTSAMETPSDKIVVRDLVSIIQAENFTRECYVQNQLSDLYKKNGINRKIDEDAIESAWNFINEAEEVDYLNNKEKYEKILIPEKTDQIIDKVYYLYKSTYGILKDTFNLIFEKYYKLNQLIFRAPPVLKLRELFSEHRENTSNKINFGMYGVKFSAFLPEMLGTPVCIAHTQTTVDVDRETGKIKEIKFLYHQTAKNRSNIVGGRPVVRVDLGGDLEGIDVTSNKIILSHIPPDIRKRWQTRDFSPFTAPRKIEFTINPL
jgi:hypothetical protein